MGKKKIVITYSAENEKNKAINLIKKLSLKSFRDSISSIDKAMDDFDILDLIDIPLQEGFELPLLKVITLSEIFKTQKNP